MMRVYLFRWIALLLVIGFATTTYAQGSVYTILGGPTISTQELSGYQKDPFVRFHVMASVESTSDISPNAMYARLGYHVKGSAVSIRSYTDDLGMHHPSQSHAMEFHNLSGSIGWKQRRPLGSLWYSYGFGVRLDYNLKAKYGPFFSGLQGTENKFTYGVDVDVAMEFPLSDLISATIELGVSPDLGEQIYVPKQYTGWTYTDGSPVILPETSLKNLVVEIRAGFRFWHKVIYTD
jgi:hypothetical protein